VQRPGVDTLWRQEGSQPPLYYLVGAALVGGIDRGDMETLLWINPHAQIGIADATHNKNIVVHTDAEASPWRQTARAVYLLRFFSIGMGTLTVALSYAVVRRAVPGRPDVALLAMALTAFNPMFLFITASVNNDNLTITLGSVALLLILRLYRLGQSVRLVLLLSLVLAFASLSKLSGLTLYPLAVLVILIAPRRRATYKAKAAALTALALGWLLIAGWWYLRNIQLYGELFGLDTMVAIAGPRDPIPSYFDLLSEFEGFRISYWGLFGGVNVLTDSWFYTYADALSVIALVGLVTWAVVQARGRHWKALLPVAFIGLQTGVVFFGVVNWTRQTLASQGRLMFPIIAGISALLALGLLGLFARRWRWPAAVLVALPLVIGALRSPADITAAYATPPVRAALPADATPVAVRWGDIELLGYRVHDADRVYAPGSVLTVTFYWRTSTSIDTAYSLYVHVLGRALDEIGKIDTYPGGGALPTTLWQPGEIIEDTYQIPIAPDARTPTVLRVSVGWWRNPDSDSVLVPVNGAGDALDGLVLDTGVGLVPIDYTNKPPMPDVPGATFGGAFTLHSYEVSTAHALPGESLDVTLYWGALYGVQEDFTVFVHLDDGTGSTYGQGDGPPVRGDYPTSLWLPGQVVTDVHTVAIDADAPPGNYVLRVGLYRLHDGSRLGAVDADGSPQPDNAFTLALPVAIGEP
jgi:4-amino-4-deoxy-L-arabinose transferase-like glycosyltransferase